MVFVGEEGDSGRCFYQSCSSRLKFLGRARSPELLLARRYITSTLKTCLPLTEIGSEREFRQRSEFQRTFQKHYETTSSCLEVLVQVPGATRHGHRGISENATVGGPNEKEAIQPDGLSRSPTSYIFFGFS